MKKLILAFIFSNTSLTFAQWSPQNSGTSNFLAQIFFPTKDTGFAVQDNGILRRTINGGVNWNIVPGSPNIYRIFFTTKDTGFATTSTKEIVKTTDGGSTWNIQYNNAIFYMQGIYFPDKNIGYSIGVTLISDSLCFLKTTDGGNNWTIQNIFQDPAIINPDIFFTKPDTGFFTSNGAAFIFMTTDGGLTVDTVYRDSLGPYLNQVFFPSKDTGYAVGTSGYILKTINGGLNWTDVSDIGNTNPLYSVYFTSNDTGYAVGGNGFSSGTILKTTDGGNSWVNEPGVIQTFNSVYFPTSNVGYVCGTNGTILKYDGTVGIYENETAQTLLFAYPNPSNGKFTLRTKAGEKNISIYNTSGQEIFSDQDFSASTTIDLSSKPKGIYFVKVLAEGKKVAVRKIMLM